VINDTGETFLPNTAVEVWCNSLHKWVSGFAVVDCDGERAAVRRAAGEPALPERFRVDDLRPA